MNTIITIGRQCGSGGREIGRILARELDVPFYDKEALRALAVEGDLGRALLESFGEKHASSLLLGLATGAYSFGYHRPVQEIPISQKISLLAFDTLRKAARAGPCVVVGRCADYALEHFEGCLNVFIHAPLAHRVAALESRHGLSEAQARQAVLETDRLRRSYYNYYTPKQWGEVDSYHLTFDSSAFGLEATAKLLQQIACFWESGGRESLLQEAYRPDIAL